ncbi:hypothetical protein [Neptuniibacter sp. QD37_11]|uniref:hypothetical protein n=1 Tax=Neptuniibacter sp. QD37_11 TaxID=3398209 RepID=UPI0039F5FB31
MEINQAVEVMNLYYNDPNTKSLDSVEKSQAMQKILGKELSFTRHMIDLMNQWHNGGLIQYFDNASHTTGRNSSPFSLDPDDNPDVIEELRDLAIYMRNTYSDPNSNKYYSDVKDLCESMMKGYLIDDQEYFDIGDGEEDEDDLESNPNYRRLDERFVAKLTDLGNKYYEPMGLGLQEVLPKNLQSCYTLSDSKLNELLSFLTGRIDDYEERNYGPLGTLQSAFDDSLIALREAVLKNAPLEVTAIKFNTACKNAMLTKVAEDKVPPEHGEKFASYFNRVQESVREYYGDPDFSGCFKTFAFQKAEELLAPLPLDRACAEIEAYFELDDETVSKVKGVLTGTIDPAEVSERADHLIRQSFHEPSHIDLVKCALNDLLECHGVESISEYNAEYLNSGDSYTPSIVFDMDRNRLSVSSYGDFIEAHDNEQPVDWVAFESEFKAPKKDRELAQPGL